MKTLLTALVLTVLPSLAMAMGCGFSHTTTTAQISCADGTTYDAASESCVPITTG